MGVANFYHLYFNREEVIESNKKAFRKRKQDPKLKEFFKNNKITTEDSHVAWALKKMRNNSIFYCIVGPALIAAPYYTPSIIRGAIKIKQYCWK